MNTAQISVIAPWGGFANHVRWLILLDPKFSFSIPRISAESYEQIKGSNWPSYENYEAHELSGISEDVIKEIDELEGYFHFDTPNRKIETIVNAVYAPARTWHNWLGYEFTFRNGLEPYAVMDHYVRPDREFDKNVLLAIDSNLAYRCYFKFNSLLNQLSVEEFKKRIAKSNDSFYNKNDEKSFKVFSADVLFQKVLDKNFYTELTHWLCLSDNYEQANLMHGIWFQLHKKAEQEFLDHTKTLYEN